jgi:hypothetical protein
MVSGQARPACDPRHDVDRTHIPVHTRVEQTDIDTNLNALRSRMDRQGAPRRPPHSRITVQNPTDTSAVTGHTPGGADDV